MEKSSCREDLVFEISVLRSETVGAAAVTNKTAVTKIACLCVVSACVGQIHAQNAE